MAELGSSEQRLMSLLERCKAESENIYMGLGAMVADTIKDFATEIIECRECGRQDPNRLAMLRAAKERAIMQEVRFMLATPGVTANHDWRSFYEQLLNHLFWSRRCDRHADASTRVRHCIEQCEAFRLALVEYQEQLEKPEQYGMKLAVADDFDEAVAFCDSMIITIKVDLQLMVIQYFDMTLLSRQPV